MRMHEFSCSLIWSSFELEGADGAERDLVLKNLFLEQIGVCFVNYFNDSACGREGGVAQVLYKMESALSTIEYVFLGRAPCGTVRPVCDPKICLNKKK